MAALRQFTEALAGRFGDEGKSARSSLESMRLALVEWDEAIGADETAAHSRPQTAELHLVLGVIYLDRRRVEDALREFSASGRLDAKRADVDIFQGLAYDLLNRPAEATQAFLQASALDPDNPATLYRLAQHLTKIGEPEQAGQALQKFRESQQRRLAEPRRSPASGSPFIRVDLLRQAAGVAPIFPPALYAQGFASLRQGRYQQALVRFKEAAAIDSLTADTGVNTDRMLHGSAALREGNLATALTDLRAAVDLAPDVAEARRVLGMAYWADEQYDKSIEQFRTAIRLRPEDERSRIALSDVLIAVGKSTEAEQTLKDAVQAMPASGQAHYALGRLYDDQLRRSDALHELQQAIDLNPLVGLDYLYQTIIRIYLSQPDFDGAIAACSNRIDVNPNSSDAHRGLGEIFLQQGRHDEALTEFLAALLTDPRSADSYSGIGQVYLRSGRYAEAVEASRRALDLDRGQSAARYALATSLVRLGRTEEGTKELEAFQQAQAEAQGRQQRDWELKMLKQEASASLYRGEHDAAVASLRKAIPYEPNAASSYVNLGAVLAKTGRHQEAIENFKKAAALNAAPEVYRFLAASYEALGQLDESRRQRAIYQRMKEERFRKTGWNR